MKCYGTPPSPLILPLLLLLQVLETSKTMTTLKLGGTMMNTASAVCMVRSLLLNQSLEFLDLHDNDLQSAVCSLEGLRQHAYPEVGHHWATQVRPCPLRRRHWGCPHGTWEKGHTGNVAADPVLAGR